MNFVEHPMTEEQSAAVRLSSALERLKGVKVQSQQFRPRFRWPVSVWSVCVESVSEVSVVVPVGAAEAARSVMLVEGSMCGFTVNPGPYFWMKAALYSILVPDGKCIGIEATMRRASARHAAGSLRPLP
jgi:hypothetical protein